MSVPSPILLYGIDEHLLATRRMVLATISGKVHAAADLATAKRLLKEVEPSLVVLCYTLSAEEREMILSFLKAACPATRALFLWADAPATTANEESLCIYEGPAALKANVAEMLSIQQAPVRGV